jgi:putative nucleotidyltransferase with HDIG domain
MKRIVFVDDEPRVLDALQRMLRPCRKEWEMEFAGDGESALALMAAAPFDVIVTDMRMPSMDGAALLQLVRERFPGVIRIILSGYFDKDAALRSVPVAHQFLAKPCDPGQLRAAIECCCNLYSVLPDEAVRRIVGTVGELPALPKTSTALVRLLEEPDIPVEKIARVIECDVAMTAKVLQLANSAFFHSSREVSSLRIAVGYLGIDVLRQLVMSVELFHLFSLGTVCIGFSLEDFQRHSVLTARIAAGLPLAAADRTVATMAALLHDAGKLVFVARLRESFERALTISQKDRRPLYLVEQELTGSNHAEVGAYLLGLWGLPKSIISAVSQHHRPAVAAAGAHGLDAVAAVHIADSLAREQAGGAGENCGFAEAGPNLEYLTELGIADRLPEWREMAAEAASGPVGT